MTFAGSVVSQWPFANSYAVASWVYVESFVGSQGLDMAAAAMASAAVEPSSGKSSRLAAAHAAHAAFAANQPYTPRLFRYVGLGFRV